ncbi:MAG: NAD-dependent epimerase/dehydratase family protein [Sedimenticola sp.]|nr:NAD-dependent epimerase/dehydratase family protein [Sedimenticola sp.]
MKVLVTGAEGFIGKNLLVHLDELEQFSKLTYSRENSVEELQGLVDQADAVIHLAGENRPKDVSAFEAVNAGLTQSLCSVIRSTNRNIPLVLASSIQADRDNPYGKSKLAAEEAVKKLAEETGNSVFLYRLPNVFGKWCKPNYNSVVATFCYNIAHDLPIQINDPSAKLRLVYVDNVIEEFLRVIRLKSDGLTMPEVQPEYAITLGELADQIQAFKNCRQSLISESVGQGLTRALYSSYVSYLDPEQFSYSLPQHGDERGVFVEMLKTKDSGQFSFFTAHPGVTRGGHYHHTKTEKFLVIKGSARFGFRHIVTNETYEIITSGDQPQVVDTVPGWTHDVTNIGDDEIVVMLWANENFDRDRPDTVTAKV